MNRQASAYLGLLTLLACQSTPPTTPSASPTPSPPTLPPVVVTSLTLTQSGGTVRAADLGWSMAFRLTEPVPGLFVRVDLQNGLNAEQSCYASEFTSSAPLAPQPTLGVTAMGFAKSPRPGSGCDDARFQATSAFVRVFGTASPFAQTPVGGGTFAVAVTVTE